MAYRLVARVLAVVLISSLGLTTRAQEGSKPAAATKPEPIALWPGDAPGERGDIGPEKDMSSANQKGIIRLGNVSRPTITVYKPALDKDTGAAIVVCPGGAYSILAWDLEGTEICEWLNSVGVTGVL